MKKLILGAIFLFLLYSVVRSGYYYSFDNDELSHAHQIYLIAKEYKPFVDFFTIYSPVFHWAFLPLFSFSGFNFETIFYARIFMISLFLLRLGLIYYLVRQVFGNRIALILLGISLLDPFNIFTGMQFRPDNLMMTTFLYGLFLLFYSLRNKSFRNLFFAGLFFGLSLLISIKILPSVFIICIVLLVYLLRTNKYKSIYNFFSGLLLPIIIFCLYFVINHSFGPMIQSLLIDGKRTNDAILFPVPLGFFYQPNNAYIFGQGGYPLGWYLSILLPIFAFFGLIIAFQTKKLFSVILIGSFLIQLLSLFFIHSIFIQYYIPLLWLQAFFASVAIDRLINHKFNILLIILFLIFAYFGWQANMSRSQFSNTQALDKIKARWLQIPENVPTFPNFLFRPSVYPLTYGYFIGDIPADIIARFPPINKILVQKKVNFLLLNSFSMSYLSDSTQTNIDKNYQKVPGDDELWIKIK